MNSSDIAIQRSILFSARIRFSPETQPIKETAIDKIVEQNLLVAHSEEGMTSEEIIEKGGICFGGGLPAISQTEIENSLSRLAKEGRIITRVKEEKKKYRLSDRAQRELRETQKHVERRFSKVVNQLFREAPEKPSMYEAPFLECLCVIFAKLGEMYVRSLKGEVGADEIMKSQAAIKAIKEISNIYTSIDKKQLEMGVLNFFNDVDPDYNAIKWNMAQNCYISKALGLDPSGYLLSRDFFGGAEFYLDTNILINALEPTAKHYKSFKALSKACQKTQISLNVCQISLDELNQVLEGRKALLEKVADQIPEEIAPKVRGIFFQLYYEQLESKGKVDIDSIFTGFEKPAKKLEKLYSVRLIDDMWFIHEESKAETNRLMKRIRIEYQEKRHRPKLKKAALHDALLIRWILEDRESREKNSWLITLDTSLPGLLHKDGNKDGASFAITLDAVLQWISPIAIQADIEDQVAEVFAEALKYQLLPPEKFFTMQDFLVFAELEWSCKELPAEDVEKCIQYLRKIVPTLDPTDPKDREKLAYEISKFFVDPSRKFKKEVQSLESEVKILKGEIGMLKKERRERDEMEKKSKFKKSAIWRLVGAFSLFSVIEALVFHLANKYGRGANFLQRLKDLWEFPTAVGFLILPIFLWFIVGKKRLSILNLPLLKKILKD